MPERRHALPWGRCGHFPPLGLLLPYSAQSPASGTVHARQHWATNSYALPPPALGLS